MVLNRRISLGTSWASSWLPTDLTGLVWWAEAASASNKSSIAGTGAVTDGTAVGYLADLSGSLNHFLAAADNTTRPTFRSTAGGSPSVQFDGSNDALFRLANLGLFDSTHCAVFIALRGNTPAASSVLFGEGGADGSGNSSLFHYLRHHASTANMSDVFARNNTATSVHGVGLLNAASAYASDKVVGVTFTSTAGEVFVDGVSIDTSTYSRVGTSTFGVASLGASRGNSTINGWFAGYFHAGLAVTTIPDATGIANIVTYLGALQGRSI